MALQTLEKYLPDGTLDYIISLLEKEPVLIRITGQRSSRLGSFSARKSTNYKAINISGHLNPYSFLVTFLHEIAHLKIWSKYGKNAEPHGEQWKKTYYELICPLIDQNIFPVEISCAIRAYFLSNKKSDASDGHLSKLLKKYNLNASENVYLEDITDGNFFYYGNERRFLKLKKIRKRYLCQELKTERKYLFSPLAEVKPDRL